MKRNKFNLSYSRLFSADMGVLIPCGLTEVLPGDSIQMQSRALVRFAPMLSPPMHPVRVRIHHWFVPHRIVWDNWESFITGGETGTDASLWPMKNAHVVVQGSLENHLGLPVGSVPAYSALPIRGYQTIWNEWYRDEDLMAKIAVQTGNGVDGTSPTIRNVAWEKDYFTSARPWEQKGANVIIPIQGAVTLQGEAVLREASMTGSVRRIEVGGTGVNPPLQIERAAGGAVGTDMFIDVSGASGTATGAGVSVNQLRESLALQRFQENRARYGSRYSEYLRAIGVRSSDARLQRPEYLGGGVQTVQFSEVLQTAQDQPTTPNPVGTLRGHGISALRGNRFRRFIEEHGFIFTMFSVLPKTIYMNGIPRHFLRDTRFKYWHKELENLGQQAVLNCEVRAAHATPLGVFGYQDRYDEYRRSESFIAGEFAATTLDYWHFGRAFASDPTLNSSFVTAVPTTRPFASTTSDPMYVQVHHSIQARRLLSKVAISRTF